MNLPEGFQLDVEEPTGFSDLPEGFVLQEEETKDVGTLQQMKQSGQQLSRDQEKVLFDAEDAKPLAQKASEAVSTFVPTAIDIAKQLGTGAGEFLYKGVIKPIDAISQSPEEADKTLKEAKNTWRSFASGVAGDIQETADAAVRFSMFGSNITDKLLGRSNEERFEKYMLREGMRQFAQKVYEDDPDNAARLLSENPLLQKLASAAALAQGATPEEAEAAKKAYQDLVKEQGLTKEEINENVSLLGEIMSPIALPGTNRITDTFGKATGKVTQKAGELALKGVAAPIAKGAAKTAGAVETGIEAIQNVSRKIGEYTVGDPDTIVKTAANTLVGPARLPAKMTRGIATTIADVASQAGPGRRGMFERAGRAATAGELTKKLFGPEALGGKGRAKAADWAVRQANAIIQPAVNGAVLNVALGLPDIETASDLGYTAGVGAGIGAYGGARLMERGGALIDPRTGLAEKIDAIVTPDPAQLRKDQDADIQRFVQTADPTLIASIDELSNVNNLKSALDLKIKNLEAKKTAQIRKEDEKRIQDQIDLFTQQRKGLEKTTPQTEAEIKRQVQLSFADAMDLAKTTGAAAGLNNIQVKVLRPDQMDDFYRDLYGKTLTDAESVVRQLVGNPRLSPSEQELLSRADQTIKQYLQDVAGASTARGFAISERTGQPEHLKLQNQKGATVVINGDLVAQMGRDGLNIGRVINHEMQHALSNFQEVRDMLAPIRKELFDQKILNPDGTFEVVSKGIVSDADLDKFALRYAAAMDSAGGASFLSQFANQDQLRNYMKEEYLSELAGLSGGIQGNLRENLDSVGRSVVDWIETKTKNGALKRIKESLRNYGVVVDDQGQFSSVIGAELNPEAMAMMRQYQRGLRDLNESLVYNSDPLKDTPEIPLTELATNRVLQERYKHSDFFEQEQVVKMTTPDGQTQEIVVPPGAKVDSFVSDYRFANGQLVDEQGNPISLGPDIPLQAMPDGTSISVDTRIARNPDGSPRILSPRESKRRAKKRGEAIRKVIDEAPDDGSGVRLEDTGNGNYRGTLSPTQIAAINALPNDLVAPSLKRKIVFFNDILGRKDGSIVEIEYQAALRDGKYRALQPQMRTEIPIGFQFDKQGNFLMTTMSLSRMYDKANTWAAKRPRNLSLWGGDMTKFWDSVRQYLHNHKAGLQGHIGLHPDPAVAMDMKNRINDLFNVYRKETREANPARTTLPKRRGQDSRDVVIRSRRMDRVNSYDETALPKMPFSYELAVQNYLPAENPFAELQTPEQFAQGMEVDAELARLAAQGNVEPLELQLHEQDLLRPAEYVDVQDGKLRVRSMFDPTQAVFDPMESEPEKPSLEVVETEVEMPQATQFMPATIEAPSGERGFKSKLQTEIQRKFTGANATPEQLKSVLGNPQNVKPEEVKWSGVMDEIDRLAQENKGKVPVQALVNYLRDEGQVKFEEVTLGGVDRMTAPRSAERLRQVLISNGYNPAEADRVVQAASRKENAYTGRNGGIIDLVQEVISDYRGLEEEQNGTTKYAQYQLPGGENYREVVLSMPSKSRNAFKGDFEILNTPVNKFTSSHFPDIPNYIAHMRVNERTDAEGNEGLFVEEFQSDRHQQGREKGYNEDQPQTGKDYKNLGWKAEKDGDTWDIYSPEGRYVDSKVAESEVDALDKMAKRIVASGSSRSAIPDAPFRKDWGVQLFKRALRDAVESGKKWIGWTTGETQAERYDLSKQIGKVVWNEDTKMLTAYDPSKKKTVIQESNVTSDKLADYVGKEVAQKLVEQSPDDDMDREISGLDLKIGGEGMKGFYDQILPKEIGKYVAKMDGKVEKSEIITGELDEEWTPVDVSEQLKLKDSWVLENEYGAYLGENGLATRSLSSAQLFDQETAIDEAKSQSKKQKSPIWRVNITPEMENVVRTGQIQFMPADAEGAMPAEQEPQGMAGVEAPQIYRRISDMIPPLQGVEPPVRGRVEEPKPALSWLAMPTQEPVNVTDVKKDKNIVRIGQMQFMPVDEIPTAKTVLKKPLENLPLRDASTWTEIQEAPIITLKDLIGKKVFPTFADITSAGRVFKGIDSSELLIPIETHGGPEWPLIQPEKVGEETNVWSNQGAGVTTTKAKRADEGAIMLVTLMDKNAHMSNTEVANAIIGTNVAYVRDKRIPEKNLKLLNKKIKSEDAFKDFVGIDSPDINDYIAKLPFQGEKSRARLATILSSKDAESLGAANVQRILDEMRSPAFEGGRIGDSVIALQLSKGAPVVKLSDSGGITHPSYQYAVRGKVIGKFARPINAEMIYDDFLAQRRAEGKPESGDRRAIDLAKPVQIITEEIANRIPQTPYKYLKSAQHAKLLKYALENDWKDSAIAKNKGGISPAEFIDTLNSSEAKVALNEYTLDSVKKEIKDGKLKLYQLGDSKVFFGTKNSDPASDYGLDPKEYGFDENEKTLTLVLNAERGTAGMGDAIMLKALSEGVTALDCFAIKNSRYPDGMLPSLYKRFGFEVVGEIPFDPQYYTPQKLADIKLFWKNNGWDESTGLPSVVLMKWKGNENDRTGTLRDIAGKSPTGIRERTELVVENARRDFERTDIGQGGSTQGRLQQGDSGRDRGSAGDAIQRVQLGRGTINAIQELLGMNDSELKNLGIDPTQIKAIKKAVGMSQ